MDRVDWGMPVKCITCRMACTTTRRTVARTHMREQVSKQRMHGRDTLGGTVPLPWRLCQPSKQAHVLLRAPTWVMDTPEKSKWAR
jgi:hypothetical protein